MVDLPPEIIGEDEFANEDNTVTLINAEGKEIVFYEIAGIVHEGEFYVILQPVELLPGMEEGEAIVFALKTVDGRSCYEPVLDKEIIDAVFAKYLELMESIDNDE